MLQQPLRGKTKISKKGSSWFHSGSNRGSFACEANGLTNFPMEPWDTRHLHIVETEAASQVQVRHLETVESSTFRGFFVLIFNYRKATVFLKDVGVKAIGDRDTLALGRFACFAFVAHWRICRILCSFLVSSSCFRNPVPHRVLHHVCTDESDSNSRRRAAHTRPVGSLPHGEWAAAPVLDIFS